MRFGINAYHAKRATCYEDCAALFNEPALLRRLAWAREERPLDGARKHHMRVVQGEGYYDVMLYRTAMARYYKPEIIGASEQHEVWYNVHGSQSSSSFQHHVLRLGASNFTKKTTHGDTVLIGMNPERSGEMFPVRLRLVDGLLYVSKSRDCPEKLGPTTSPERKADRKAFKKWLRPYEAMSKIMERGATYTNFRDIAHYYMTNELFDPTGLVSYIQVNGISAAVDKVYPLGDVQHYNESFKVIS